MRIEALYTLANELDQDLEVSEEFDRDEKVKIIQSVLTFINFLSLEEFDLSYVLEKRNEILLGVDGKSLQSRAVMSFFHDVELYSEEENKFREAMV
jgi:hypothetical protein